MIEKYLEEFGNTMGISNLRLNENDCLSLDIENVGKFYLERHGNRIFARLLHTFQQYPLPCRCYEEAFNMAEQQLAYPFPIEVVSNHESDLGFALQLFEIQCDVPTLTQILRFLISLINSFLKRIENF